MAEKSVPVSPDFGNHSLDYSNENDCNPIKKSLSLNDIAKLCDSFEFNEAAINKRYNVPTRERSTKPQILRPNGLKGKLKLTVPKTPKFGYKARAKPVHIVSQKEKEEMEIEEMKKYKIKALPIPNFNRKRPKLPEVPKKRAGLVKPEPFSFAKRDEENRKRKEERIKQQIEQQSKHTYQFKAQPLPAAIKKRMQSAATRGCTSKPENKENQK